MKDCRKLRLNFESSLDSVDAAELIVERLAQLSGFDADQVYQIGMGVRETMVNAICHGNRLGSAKTVSFEASIDESAMQVIIRDEGTGFDPSEVDDPLKGEHLLRGSGRGLLIMKAFFDEVEVSPGPGPGTNVRLVKYCAQGA